MKNRFDFFLKLMAALASMSILLKLLIAPLETRLNYIDTELTKIENHLNRLEVKIDNLRAGKYAFKEEK